MTDKKINEKLTNIVKQMDELISNVQEEMELCKVMQSAIETQANENKRDLTDNELDHYEELENRWKKLDAFERKLEKSISTIRLD